MNNFALILFLFFCINGLSSQKLIVTSRAENNVTIIDLETGEKIRQIKVGNEPHELLFNPWDTMVYVTNYGDKVVSKIDLLNKSLDTFFVFQDHLKLHGIAASKDGKTIWVTSEAKKAVLEIDTQKGSLIKAWPTLGYRSHMLTPSKDNNKLYVANLDENNVSIINRKANETKLLETGKAPEGIDISLNGKEVWVTNRQENTISIINTETDRVIEKIPSHGEFPVKLKFAPNGKQVWVSNNRSSSVAVFNSKEYRLEKLIDVGERPLWITFSNDSNRAYISKPGSHEVLEIDTLNYVILRRIKVSKSPDGVVYVSN